MKRARRLERDNREVTRIDASRSRAWPLRALDALHLRTFVLTRQKLGDLELLTVNHRLQEAAGVV